MKGTKLLKPSCGLKEKDVRVAGMIKVLPVKMSHLCGIILKEYAAPNVLLFGSVNLNNSPKELNIDMEISFENQFLNSKFQKALNYWYFPITSTTLVMLIHFVCEERRI